MSQAFALKMATLFCVMWLCVAAYINLLPDLIHMDSILAYGIFRQGCSFLAC